MCPHEGIKSNHGVWVYYTKYGNLSLELDREHCDEALTSVEMDLLAPYLKQSKYSLHLCCGMGRHVAAFVQAGIASIGVDISSHLVAYGRIHMTPEVKTRSLMIQGEATAPPIRNGAVDTITVLGNSLTLFSQKQVSLVFAAAQQLLATRGMFIFDLPDVNYILSHLELGSRTVAHESTASLGPICIETERTINSASRTLFSHERWTFTHPAEGAKVIDTQITFQLYSAQDIASLAADHGFKIVACRPYQDHSGQYTGLMKRREFYFLVKERSR